MWCTAHRNGPLIDRADGHRRLIILLLLLLLLQPRKAPPHRRRPALPHPSHLLALLHRRISRIHIRIHLVRMELEPRKVPCGRARLIRRGRRTRKGHAVSRHYPQAEALRLQHCKGSARRTPAQADRQPRNEGPQHRHHSGSDSTDRGLGVPRAPLCRSAKEQPEGV